MIYLHKHSSKILSYAVADVPVSTALASAYWTLKESPDDSDDDALVMITVTTDVSVDGMITDDGTTDHAAAIEFYLPATAVTDLELDRNYFCSAKVKLDNDEVFVLPASIETVRIRPAGVTQE